MRLECRPGFDFITPIVKLEPLGLILNLPAKLYLPIDQQRVGINNAYNVFGIASPALNSSWKVKPYLYAPIEMESKWEIQSELLVKQFALVAKGIAADIKPNNGAIDFGFYTQKFPEPMNISE